MISFLNCVLLFLTVLGNFFFFLAKLLITNIFFFQDGSKSYIIFKPKEEKKSGLFGVFGGSDSGKKVYVKSRESARQLSRIVEDLRLSQN